MAFNHLGTLSQTELTELENFLKGEIEDIEQQINTLNIEKNKLIETRSSFLTVDKNFGGGLEDEIVSGQDKKIPYRVKVLRQDDANSAIIIDKLKKPFVKNIKYKRERLEYKIRKLTDMIEQMGEEIDRKAIAKTQTGELMSEVRRLFTTANANHLFRTTKEKENYLRNVI